MLAIAWGALAAFGFLLVLPGKPRAKTSIPPERWSALAISVAVVGIVWLIGVPVLGFIAGVAVFVALEQRRTTQRQRIFQERSEAWPDAVDFIISSVRAGMSIASSLIALQEQGPEVLRPILLSSRNALAQGRSVQQALVLMRASANDPIADRIALILEISQNVGGASLGVVLRSLSRYVREEARTRAELISRQSWTVNAAKLAAVAPWFIVLLLSLRAHDAYATAAGSTLLAIGAVATFLGYRWMRRAAQLPVMNRLA